MSPEGKDMYQNNLVYGEATDPLNYAMAGAGVIGKAGKVLGALSNPAGEAITAMPKLIKQYGKILESNAVARSAAKRRFL